MSILLVEDEPALRELLAEFLFEEGYLVESCDSFEAARSMLAGGSYDLVVTDNKLAGPMTGADLLHYAAPRYVELGLVLMSGNLDPPAGLPARAVFVAKPYTCARLRDALRQAKLG